MKYDSYHLIFEAMKIDYNKQVKGLDGTDLQGDQNTMAKILANLLAYSSSGPMVKFMDWARDLYRGKTLEIDRTDADVLKAFVEGSNLPNLTKEQMVNVILEAAVEKPAMSASSNKNRNRS